jgi:hypothetical protein
MCGSKGGDSGKDARRAEAERQAAIQAGTAQVNKAFGTFTDDYFGGLQDDYTSYYTPQLEEQFNKARKNLILNNPGGSATSSFAQRMSELEKQYREQQGVISGQAVDAATQLALGLTVQRVSQSTSQRHSRSLCRSVRWPTYSPRRRLTLPTQSWLLAKAMSRQRRCCSTPSQRAHLTCRYRICHVHGCQVSRAKRSGSPQAVHRRRLHWRR